MSRRGRTFLVVTATAIWLGGLTFYALVVVPIGTEIVGVGNQGLITERVTAVLNLIAVAGLSLLGWDLVVTPRRGPCATWLTMVACQAALFALHRILSGMLEVGILAETDHGHFYQWHRAYLIVTTVQWFAGIAHVWQLITCSIPPVELKRFRDQKS
jgi:hypothetical protein